MSTGVVGSSKKVSTRQWAEGANWETHDTLRLATDYLRLCRLAVRKGSAFPTLLVAIFCKAAPDYSFGGVASEFTLSDLPVSRRLTALHGGKAASLITRFFSLLPTAHCLLPTILLLLTAHCSLLTVYGQFSQTQGNSPLYSSRPYEARAPSGLPKALNDVGIDQRLNEQLPLDLVFRNENGELVRLGDYFGNKPVVLSLVYYQCPMLCNQVLNGMVTSFRVMAFQPGQEFEVVTVSFDSRETTALAAAKKNTYVNYLPEARRSAATNGWHFLTGDEANIRRLTEAVGFRYHFDAATNQFAHGSAIYVTTPQGKLARYFYGIEYAPRDLRLGLIEAAGNKIGSPVDQLLLYCYHYDPATGKYGAAVMNMMRLGGVVTLIAVVGLLFALRRRGSAEVNLRAGGTA
ncbi:MAG: SCO family protein [Pyrinomonadaceae bacterium]